MAAFFRNTTQNPLDGNISDTPPVIVVPRREDRARWEQIAEEEARLKERMTKMRTDSGSDFAKWLDEDARGKISGPLDPADEIASFSAVEGRVTAASKNKPVEVTLPDGAGTLESATAKRGAMPFVSRRKHSLNSAISTTSVWTGRSRFPPGFKCPRAIAALSSSVRPTRQVNSAAGDSRSSAGGSLCGSLRKRIEL